MNKLESFLPTLAKSFQKVGLRLKVELSEATSASYFLSTMS